METAEKVIEQSEGSGVRLLQHQDRGDTRGTDRIALWMLDTDYDGRSLFPKQVFFSMFGEKDGWSRLAKNLKVEIDEELIEAYRGTISLPFEPPGSAAG